MDETFDKVYLLVDRLGLANVNNNNAGLVCSQSADISRFPASKLPIDDVNDSVDTSSKSVFGQSLPRENELSVATDGSDGVKDDIDFNILCDTNRTPNIVNNPLDVSMGYENSFKNELRKAMVTVAQNRGETGFLKKLRNKFLSGKKDTGLECTTIYCQCIETVVTNSSVQPSNVTRTNSHAKPSVFSVLGRAVVDLFGCDLPDDT